ncbi:MAG: hypothetical protein JNK05_04410 [Myxococcales bacterium]|nr:hypothetical protein [Myxococcales bacterium]
MSLLAWPQELDVESLFARVCQPKREQLDAVSSAVEGVEDPREALERLAARSMVPMEWVESRARAFGGDARSPQVVPKTVAGVVALAADVPGVLASEALAREFLVRARAWCELPTPEAPIFWKLDAERPRWLGARTTKGPAFPPGISALFEHALSGAQLALLREELADRSVESEREPEPERRGGFWDGVRRIFSRSFPTPPPGPIPLWNQLSSLAVSRGGRALEEAIEDHRNAWLFATLARTGRAVPESIVGSTRVRSALAATPLRALDNYFEPLAALWWTGYAVHSVTAERVELVCPAFE